MAMLEETQKQPDDPAELRAAAERLVSVAKAQALRIAKLEHQLAGLRRQRFGATSERLEQLDLALEETEIEAARATDPAAPEDAGEAKRKPRRKPLPKELARTETILSPGETCTGCGGSLKQLGEDVTCWPDKPSSPTTRRSSCRCRATVRPRPPASGPMSATNALGRVAGPPATWYKFTIDRKGQHLAGYRGWVHADGYSGFNELYRSGTSREVACLAHIRRKFVDIAQSQTSPIAEEAIKRIADLYAVEKQARGRHPDGRVELRQARARPLLDALEDWLQAQLPRISGKSELAKTRILTVRRFSSC